jgi:hypothetical protein
VSGAARRGGHSAAMEVPDLFADDVRAFLLALAKDDAPAGRG